MHPIHAVIVSALVVVSAVQPASANWLSKLGRAADNVPVAGAKLAKTGVASLDNAAAHVATLATKPGTVPLAAHISHEGHWTFAGRTGETFTAASPAELKRGLAILAPESAKADAKLAVYLTEDSVFTHRAKLPELPSGTALNVVVDSAAYPLLVQGSGASARLFAQIRPNLVIATTEHSAFREAAFQLARPVDKSAIRIIGLEPGGPTTLPSGPRIDSTNGRARVDAIDPAHIATSLSKIKRQTILISGRIEGDRLFVKPSNASEMSVSLREITVAAEAADINLIIMKSAAARQPGGRNWLWQTIELKGVDQALQQPTLADVVNALGSPANRLVVSASPKGSARAVLDIRPAKDLPNPATVTDRLSDVFADLVSELSGKVISEGLEANVVNEDRRRELDNRIIPGLPSSVQWTYIVLALLGLFGLPVARRWWEKIWPQEVRSEYGNAFGYWSARAIRLITLLLVFVPVAALATAPIQALTKLWDMLRWPLRLWHRLTGRHTMST
jgi:hypothetical protein